MSKSKSPPPTTVYLAEDHVAIRELLVRHLEMLPAYRVVGQASDGTLVAADCQRLKPRVLVLDLGLPGVGGVEIAQTVTRESPHTRILVFTAHHTPAVVRQALEAGALGMVEKSAPFDTLLRALEAVAVGRAFFGEAITQQMQQAFQAPAANDPSGGLTPREHEVLKLVAGGRSNKEIAEQLGISIKTAENHRHNLMTKLDAHNAADLTRAAFQFGVLVAGAAPR
ncbi:MAG: response regulator transcription factor [Verrucomicrobia bacterium]|nr:response regulator transcription factor [Verrucomicrobiota bacterium]